MGDALVRRFFAHSLPPPHTIDEWEPLEVHLRAVAALAAEFAKIRAIVGERIL